MFFPRHLKVQVYVGVDVSQTGNKNACYIDMTKACKCLYKDTIAESL